MDATATVDTGIPEGIEAEMAADEQAWAQEERQTPAGKTGRDAQGRFTSAEPEDGEAQEAEPSDAQRAGEQTEGEANTGSTEAKPSEGQKPAPTEQQKPEDKEKAEQDERPAGNQSRWAKENERKAKTWEGINQEKAQLKAEREQIQLEKEQLEAQRKAAQAVRRDDKGHTAETYAKWSTDLKAEAGRLMQRAMQAEANGDFEGADALNAEAAKTQKLVAEADRRAEALKGESVWAKLAKDFPEAVTFNSPINAELRKAIREDANLLADEHGPYRALLRIGERTLKSQTAELTKFKAEAAKVPELTKQRDDALKEVQRLTALTSLQGDGAPLSRESASGRRFEDLSEAEMEREIESTILQR